MTWKGVTNDKASSGSVGSSLIKYGGKFYIGICREISFFENQLTTKAVICMEASIDNVEYI